MSWRIKKFSKNKCLSPTPTLSGARSIKFLYHIVFPIIPSLDLVKMFSHLPFPESTKKK